MCDNTQSPRTDQIVVEEGVLRPSQSDRIDRISMHRLGGVSVFVSLITIVFQAVFTWAIPLMETIDNLFWIARGAHVKTNDGVNLVTD